jgi:asparagine synthase (glutamine-hydrolysing)
MASARLAIIDLDPEANQPLDSADGSWQLVYNGEIYNFRELATSYGLSTRAHRSDTWMLLELIQSIGVTKAREQLRGMYAFAAWEKAAGRLWLARDPFGIKPLAWSRLGSLLLFSSDPRSIASWRRHLEASSPINPYSLTHFLMVGYVPGDATMWSPIDRVEPGTVIALDSDATTFYRWDPLQNRPSDTDATIDEVDAAVRRSVERHLIADVDVGSFLSGGIDSSLITSIARRDLTASMRTYSVGFCTHEVPDETPEAERMAAILATKHTTLRLSSDRFQDLALAVGEAFPEPHADPAAMPMLALSERARNDVKVVLTGEGGDEMFGGYRRHWAFPLARRNPAQIASKLGLGEALKRLGGRRARQVVDSMGGSAGSGFLSYLTQLHWDRLVPVSAHSSPQVVSDAIARYEPDVEGDPTPQSMRYLELRRHLPETYLEKGDRTTMFHGLEARVPFLDLDLASVALRIKSDMLARPWRTKLLLRKVASRHLPLQTHKAPKRGLTVPLVDWLSQPAASRWTRESLLGGYAAQHGLVEEPALTRLLKDIADVASPGNAEATYRLLCLELWCRSAARDGAL